MSDWWVSCSKMTIYVKVSNEIIVETAPITKRFIGQRFSKLLAWLRRFGDVEKHKILTQV